MRTIKGAACILIPVDGLYLAVSRKNNTTKWGLPGGKREAGERLIDCAIRETFEETGLKFDESDLTLIYIGNEYDSGAVLEFVVAAYMTLPYGPELLRLVTPEHGTAFQLMTKESLCDLAISPFASYNKNMFNALELSCEH